MGRLHFYLIFEFYVFFAEGLFNFVHILFKLRFLLRRIDGFQNFDVVIAHRFNYFGKNFEVGRFVTALKPASSLAVTLSVFP